MSPDRLERRMPEVLTELALPRSPDYIDDLLGRTARMPQRPGWTFLERWLPVDTLARPVPFGLPSWRPIVTLALLLVVLAVGTILFAGSRLNRLPPPFGLAANGSIAFATADGDILAVDPATGRTRELVTGATMDVAPSFFPTGDRFLFVRTTPGGDALMVANADGSGIRELVPAGKLGNWVEISPSGDRVVISNNLFQRTVNVIDVASGASTSLEWDLPVGWLAWRPGHEQVALMSGGSRSESPTMWLASPDGSGLQQLPTRGSIVTLPTLSSDGRTVVYCTWDDDGAGGKGLIHVLEIETGQDRELGRSIDLGRLNPTLSPDGTRILLERYDAVGYRVAILPVDGGAELVLGDTHPEGADGAVLGWSPDGTKVLVTHRDDGSTWLFAADGSSAERVTWPTTEMTSWQRLAP